MRKILLLSTVCLMSFGLFAQQQANAGNWATYDQMSKHLNSFSTADKQDALLEYLKGIFPASAEENSAQIAAAAMQNTAGQTYLATTNAQLGKDVEKTGIVVDNMGIAENGCSAVTSVTSLGSGNSNRVTVYSNIMNNYTQIVAGKNDYKNGEIDSLKNLFENSVQKYCDPSIWPFCSGDGSNQGINAQTIFDPNISSEEQAFNDYKMELFFGSKQPLSLNPDLLEEPTTDTKAAITLIERFRGQLSVAMEPMAYLMGGNSQPGSEGRSFPFSKEILEAGDFLDATALERLFPSNGEGASHNAQLEALVIGLMNPNLMKEKLFGVPEKAYLQSILYNIGVSNYIQMEQLKLLERIAVANGLSLSLELEPERQLVNQKIQSLNGGR